MFEGATLLLFFLDYSFIAIFLDTHQKYIYDCGTCNPNQAFLVAVLCSPWGIWQGTKLQFVRLKQPAALQLLHIISAFLTFIRFHQYKYKAFLCPKDIIIYIYSCCRYTSFQYWASRGRSGSSNQPTWHFHPRLCLLDDLCAHACKQTASSKQCLVRKTSLVHKRQNPSEKRREHRLDG